MEGEQSTEQNIQVVVRVKPAFNAPHCLQAVKNRAVTVASKPKNKHFIYDYVAAPDSTQDEIFERVGKPITQRVLSGYNGTVFAYGQTGSGKTHTMIGPLDSSEKAYEMRGLIPRVIEYLFHCIEKTEERSAGDIKFNVKCSYLEIYNERCYDLFSPDTSKNIVLQEDVKMGVQVINLSEEAVCNVSEALDLMQEGSTNRRIVSTAMNVESSRSHAVFTIYIESTETVEEKTITKQSKFNLVDLAGSERHKHSKVDGIHLKEAGQINRSLSVLGNVIQALVDIGKGKPRHVHYRDSKLTFLLKDSLGGNSLTYLIATISPIGSMIAETLSTLKFASRAKTIKNQAVINAIDLSGRSSNEKYLLQQNKMLKQQIYDLKHSQPRSRSFGDDGSISQHLIASNLELEEKFKSLQQNLEGLEDKYNKQHYSNLMLRKILKKRVRALQGQVKSKSADDLRIVELQDTINTLVETHQEQVDHYEEQLKANPAMLKLQMRIEELNYRLKSCSEQQMEEMHNHNSILKKKVSELMHERENFVELKSDLPDVEGLQSRIQELEGEVDTQKGLLSKIPRLEAQLEEAKKLIGKLRSELDNSAHELRNREQSVSQMRNKIEELETTVDKQNLQLKKEGMSVSEMEEATALLYDEIEELRLERNDLVELLEEVTKERDGYRKKAKDRRKSVLFRQQALESEIDEYKEYLVELYDELKDVKEVGGELLADQKDEFEELIMVVMDEIEHCSSDLSEKTDRISDLEKEKEQLTSKTDELEVECRRLASQLDRAQVDLELLEDDNDSLCEQVRFLTPNSPRQ